MVRHNILVMISDSTVCPKWIEAVVANMPNSDFTMVLCAEALATARVSQDEPLHLGGGEIDNTELCEFQFPQ